MKTASLFAEGARAVSTTAEANAPVFAPRKRRRGSLSPPQHARRALPRGGSPGFHGIIVIIWSHSYVSVAYSRWSCHLPLRIKQTIPPVKNPRTYPSATTHRQRTSLWWIRWATSSHPDSLMVLSLSLDGLLYVFEKDSTLPDLVGAHYITPPLIKSHSRRDKPMRPQSASISSTRASLLHVLT